MIDQSINPHEFLKNHKKMFEKEDKALKSMTQQVESKGFSKDKGVINHLNSLDKL